MKPALAVASECVPLVKTGGLADVTGALPGAMAANGWGVRTLLPGYRMVMAQAGHGVAVLDLPDLCGGPARVLALQHDGLDLLVLDAPHLYDRDGSPYLDAEGNDWPDNDLRFAALCQVAARIAGGALGDWVPRLLHLHDWQAALVPEYLALLDVQVPVVMTIHNIAFHGLTTADRIAALGLERARFTPEGYEYYGHVSALKAGLVGADRITTVSPTYARELTTPAFGMGLDGVIRARQHLVGGILNGIDTALWNPARDPHIHRFRAPRGKAAARRALREDFALPASKGPLAVVISRLSAQKGLDLLLEALPGFIAAGGQLALLGSGDRALEHAWLQAARDMAGVSVRIGYDEALAHRMFAGADAVLVPSRFEPCGLTQLYALRYGAVPVVARTGGLADTVIHANDAALRAGVATGLVHDPDDAAALSAALAQLCALHARPQVWSSLQTNGMKHPVGWESSSRDYARLFETLVG
ncbi:glycogen synthase GlgA [Rhodobacteraceae bacterium 2376]|uniref:Glycogen synthase n=1 Tax=Rhabdonatronobacter sediminivivens TaxID=2743469 RepID=A0A7Z0KXJ3_9RHOB|nr:glycogen synthase GlgA [Rhabdonatronobacter sediminivivens]NYS23691.1 glycogen synthase GlgA [Rhabdonatronobacter sediminivivens]